MPTSTPAREFCSEENGVREDDHIHNPILGKDDLPHRPSVRTRKFSAALLKQMYGKIRR